MVEATVTAKRPSKI